MNKTITTQRKLRYIPVKIINKQIMYFKSAARYGRDKDGILRVCKTKWESECYENNCMWSEEKAKEILAGILKYDADKDAEYKLAKITIVEKMNIEM